MSTEPVDQARVIQSSNEDWRDGITVEAGSTATVFLPSFNRVLQVTT